MKPRKETEPDRLLALLALLAGEDETLRAEGVALLDSLPPEAAGGQLTGIASYRRVRELQGAGAVLSGFVSFLFLVGALIMIVAEQHYDGLRIYSTVAATGILSAYFLVLRARTAHSIRRIFGSLCRGSNKGIIGTLIMTQGKCGWYAEVPDALARLLLTLREGDEGLLSRTEVYHLELLMVDQPVDSDLVHASIAALGVVGNEGSLRSLRVLRRHRSITPRDNPRLDALLARSEDAIRGRLERARLAERLLRPAAAGSPHDELLRPVEAGAPADPSLLLRPHEGDAP